VARPRSGAGVSVPRMGCAFQVGNKGDHSLLVGAREGPARYHKGPESYHEGMQRVPTRQSSLCRATPPSRAQPPSSSKLGDRSRDTVLELAANGGQPLALGMK
jgi:hypothetical protein